MNPRGDFPDVDALAVGASAGGVEALLALLAALPPAFGAAVLVVLHRPAEAGEDLVRLLASVCRLPVAEPLDKQPIPRGEVLLAPPGYHLLVEDDGHVALSVDAPVLHSRPAIDPLFETAAQHFGPRLLALLLTGASHDGAQGVAAVRRQGGLAWVQDPADAMVPTMPAAALALGGADEVLSLRAMCGRLAMAGRR